MQNLKGVIRVFTIILVIVCFIQLSFTFFAKRVESKADEYGAKHRPKDMPKGLTTDQATDWHDYADSVEKANRLHYIDSVMDKPVVDFPILRLYTYKLCRERALNLGLDLKGGMSLTMTIAEDDVLKKLAGNGAKNPNFIKALESTKAKLGSAKTDFLTLFQQEFEAVAGNDKLANCFKMQEQYHGKIDNNTSNNDVIKVLRNDFNSAIKETFNVLKTRIDQFGVASPNISLQENTGRIILELPGIDDPRRVTKILQQTAQLEFWDTYEFVEVIDYLKQVNDIIKSPEPVLGDSSAVATTAVDSAGAKKDSASIEAAKVDTSKANENPLWNLIVANTDEKGYLQDGPVVGWALGKDTATVNQIFGRSDVKAALPAEVQFLWAAHPTKMKNRKNEDFNVFYLYAIKRIGDKAPLGGDAITDATQQFDQNGQGAEVELSMNSAGANTWEHMTDVAANATVKGKKVKKCIAIVLDNKVFSAPHVQQKISGGRSSITGIGEIEEATDLANILKSGKLEAKIQVVQAEVIGPSLGAESIKSGVLSLLAGVLLVFLFMVAYYSRSGVIANIALILNFFILISTLISIGAAFTLPALAGVILTMAMAVDANVIINERVREEIARGKGMRLAVDEGYQHSYSAIIDGNFTTMVASIVLMVFGLGPIHGFGLTLFIGIITSLFTAVLVSRTFFDSAFDRNIKMSFGNKYTMNVLKNVNFDFIGKRKFTYTFSAILFAIALSSMIFYGFDLGVDFKGGRSYVIQFDKDVKAEEVTKAVEKSLSSTPQVKTYGKADQVSITTSDMIESRAAGTDSIVEMKIYNGVKGLYTNPPSLDKFRSKYVKSTVKIESTIADDIKKSAFYAIFFGLGGIFLYIFIRFRKFEYAVGAVVATIHDPIIILGVFSLFRKIMPFSLEIDQNIVAAVLTLIGYSVNDTVVVFDRIREYLGLHPTRTLKQNVNDSINSTLSRTVMTVVTVFMVSLILFIFGGIPLRGFSFALIVGLLVGSYSSIFVASPIMVDLMNRRKKKV